MRMRADDERGAAVDKVRHGHFFAGGLGVHVDHGRVAGDTERTGAKLPFDRREGVVERVHEHAALHIDHENLLASRRRVNIRSASRRARRVVHGPQQTGLPLDENQRLALVEGVIAERHAIRAGLQKFVADGLGDAKAAGGVLAIDDDEIQLPELAQPRQPRQQGGTAGAADHIADEQQTERGGCRIVHGIFRGGGRPMPLTRRGRASNSQGRSELALSRGLLNLSAFLRGYGCYSGRSNVSASLDA